MKIAIVGAGFFGLTLGLILSKKHKIEIFEKKKSILHGASSANQFRFHHGFHYYNCYCYNIHCYLNNY